jgi:Tol biopolymer transport system component
MRRAGSLGIAAVLVLATAGCRDVTDNGASTTPRSSGAATPTAVGLPTRGPGTPDATPDAQLKQSWLAFSAGEQGVSSDIYVARADGSELRQLTHGPYFRFNPAWSPDGSGIAYRVEHGPEGTPPDTPESEHYGIWLVAADGSTDVSLSRVSGVVGGAPSWSPDGRRIAFMGHLEGERPEGIWVVDADGTDAARLTPASYEAQYPAWSPDGTQIAFTIYRAGAFTINVMDANGSHVRELTLGPEDNWPVWSPDGRQIAFSRAQALFVTEADGTNARPVPGITPECCGVPAAWAPGPLLAFNCAVDAIITICAGNPDGTDLVRLLGGRDAGFPAWRAP